MPKEWIWERAKCREWKRVRARKREEEAADKYSNNNSTKNRTEIFIFIVCILLSIFLCISVCVLTQALTAWLRVLCAFARSQSPVLLSPPSLLLFAALFITSFHSLIIIVYRNELCSEAYVIRFSTWLVCQCTVHTQETMLKRFCWCCYSFNFLSFS